MAIVWSYNYYSKTMTELCCGRGRCLRRTCESNAMTLNSSASVFIHQAQGVKGNTRHNLMDAAHRNGLKSASLQSAVKSIDTQGLCNGVGDCGVTVNV